MTYSDIRTSDESASVDPLCVVFNQPFGRSWQEYARTETQKDTRNPAFKNKIKIPYLFEEQQLLKFQVFNAESNSPTLGKHTYLGQVECTLAQIVSCQLYSADVKLNGKFCGKLTVSVREIGNNREEVELKFSASHLRRNGLPFTHPDPFLELFTQNKSIMLRRTTWLSNTKNPTWPSIYVPLRLLKNDQNKQLNISCFHHGKDGEHHLLGEVQVHPGELLKAPNAFTLKKHVSTLVSNKKTIYQVHLHMQGHSVRGELQLITSQVCRAHSFLDYISAGIRLHCIFAIDFTGISRLKRFRPIDKINF